MSSEVWSLTEMVAMRKIVVIAALLAAIPALAQQNSSECADRFKATDLNNDGVITHTEIANARQLPPALAKESLVSRNEFMAACAKMQAVESQQFDKSAAPSPHSTGTTVSPADKGVMQPQGPTGPLNTTTGGAPAESPQGQTPPGMQAAPDGSSKTIVDPSTKSK
jgi:hypothetical protein